MLVFAILTRLLLPFEFFLGLLNILFHLLIKLFFRCYSLLLIPLLLLFFYLYYFFLIIFFFILNLIAIGKLFLLSLFCISLILSFNLYDLIEIVAFYLLWFSELMLFEFYFLAVGWDVGFDGFLEEGLLGWVGVLMGLLWVAVFIFNCSWRFRERWGKGRTILLRRLRSLFFFNIIISFHFLFLILLLQLIYKLIFCCRSLRIELRIFAVRKYDTFNNTVILLILSYI